MHCHDAQQRLKEAIDGDRPIDPALGAHLRRCATCATLAEDLRLARLLRALPVPPPTEGFADRVLERAWRETRRSVPSFRPSVPTPHSGAPYWAAAAAVLLTLVVLMANPWRDGSPAVAMEVVRMAPHSVREVDVRLVSAEALPDATISLRLDAGLGLAGYGDTRELSWPSPLQAGSNQLSLPLELRGDRGGVIHITITAGNARRELRLSVEPESPGPTAKPKLLI